MEKILDNCHNMHVSMVYFCIQNKKKLTLCCHCYQTFMDNYNPISRGRLGTDQHRMM